MGFMSCIVNFGTVTLQSSINKLGTNIITAHTAARKIFDILDVVLYIIGNAVTTFVSQNLGAKRIDRVKTGVRAGIIINTIATTIIILIGFPASPLLIRLIAGTNDPAVIDPAVMYIRISVCCFYVLGPLFVLRCAMQGMGRKIVPVLSSTMEMVGKSLLFCSLLLHLAISVLRSQNRSSGQPARSCLRSCTCPILRRKCLLLFQDLLQHMNTIKWE